MEIAFRDIIQMKIHPINPVNNPVKLQLEIGSSGKITANIKFNREEIGENTEKKSKTAENNLGNLPDELHSEILNDLDGQELVKCMRVSKQFSNTIKECPPLNRKVQDIQFSRAILQILQNDTDDYVRIAVVVAFGNIGENDLTGAILQRLQNDPDYNVRIAVAKACGNIGDNNSTRAILQSLQNDTDSRVRIAVAEACGNIGDKVWTRAILESLKDNKCSLVRIAVAKACGRIGDKAWTRAILQSLKHDTSEFVKIYVVEALLKN